MSSVVLASKKHGKVAAAALIYFMLAFGGGFVLAIPRTLWAVPRYGERAAELLEAPIMMLVILSSARWVTRRYGLETLRQCIAVGSGGLALLLVAEIAVVLGVRQLTLSAYLNGRDIVAGSVYVALLGLFATMPAALLWFREGRLQRSIEGAHS